jgi:hypothetical protein
MGGSEYIADFLIGPETTDHARKKPKEVKGENIAFAVHHGDSGTVMFIEHEERDAQGHSLKPPKFSYYPFALLWGRNDFIEDGKRLARPFALATSLSTALDRLNLDLVRDINAGQEYIWGWVGHYLIGGMLPPALGLLNSATLRKFAEKNIELLTMTPDSVLGNDPKVLDKGATSADNPHFVPLADVPDNVWKSNVNFFMTEDSAGKKHHNAGPGSRGKWDNPNHYADIDLPYKGSSTFLSFVLGNPTKNLKPQVWMDYYTSLKPKYDAWAAALGQDTPDNQLDKKHLGALPFRVWQLFDAMVAAAKAGKEAEFLVAGGVLIHYIGDACQPLHTSYLSQGDPNKVVNKPVAVTKKMLEADGVHSGYEDEMVNYGFQKKDLSKAVDAEIKKQEKLSAEKIATMKSGFDAAKAVMDLIAATRTTLLPSKIVKRWVEVHPLKKDEREQAMWASFGTPTIKCMARGSRYLAKMWNDAWVLGKGSTKIGQGSKHTQKQIAKLYNDKNFLKSVPLNEYPGILK